MPAQVVYSGDQNIVMGSYAYSSPFNFWNSASTLKIDFNLDGTSDIALFRGFTVFALVGVGGLNGGQFSKTPANVSRAWVAGESIDSTATWTGGTSFGELNGGTIGLNPQYWSSYSQRGYIGARFPLLDGLHYGWIDYQSEPNAISGTVFGWAWETRPDVAIIAGDRGLAAVPEPSTYALAAVAVLGGLIARRRRR